MKGINKYDREIRDILSTEAESYLCDDIDLLLRVEKLEILSEIE